VSADVAVGSDTEEAEVGDAQTAEVPRQVIAQHIDVRIRAAER
jgi:hypothetical protein